MCRAVGPSSESTRTRSPSGPNNGPVPGGPRTIPVPPDPATLRAIARGGGPARGVVRDVLPADQSIDVHFDVFMADDQGKELLQQVATLASDLDLRNRAVDIAQVAPRQPRGRKAEIGVRAMRGALSGRIGPLADKL